MTEMQRCLAKALEKGFELSFRAMSRPRNRRALQIENCKS